MNQESLFKRAAKFAFAALVSAAAFAALAITLPTLVESPEEWVASRSGQLPQTYQEISSFPAAYRMQIVAELPSQAQARLWQEHFEIVLGSRPHLDAAQKSLIQAASRRATPESFDRALQAAGETPPGLLELAHQIESRFDRQRAWEIFYQLGSPEPTYQSASSWPIWASDLARGIFSASARGIRCNCAVGAPPGPQCLTSVCVLSTSCLTSPTGCGPMGLSACNGCC
jgi:hypothetical protein